jgi:hypothetical protein
MFIEYAREMKNGQVQRDKPFGVLVCEFGEDGQLWFGWSLCNRKHDHFNKKKALHIAKARLNKCPLLSNELPRSLQGLAEHMKDRIRGRHYYERHMNR